MSPFRKSRKREGLYTEVYEVTRRIPLGCVATYGQLASLVEGCTPRMVGYAMAAVPPGMGVPWHRVINHKGMISDRAHGDGDNEQRARLEAEGIPFDERDRVNLKIYGWQT